MVCLTMFIERKLSPQSLSTLLAVVKHRRRKRELLTDAVHRLCYFERDIDPRYFKQLFNEAQKQELKKAVR